MRFLNQDILYLLLLAPLFVIIFIIGTKLVKNRLARLGGIQINRMVKKSFSGRRRRLKFILILISLILMVTALARPQYGSELIKIKSTGTEVWLLFQVRLSFNAR